MATPTFCCGFECGITASHWSLANASFSTTTVRSSLRSLRSNPSGTAANNAGTNFNVGGTLGVMRVYVRFATLPTADTGVCGFRISAANNIAGLVFKNSDSKLYPGRTTSAGVISFGADGITVTTGVWYRVDIRVNVVANPWLVDVQVDGVATSQASLAVAADTLTTVVCGKFDATVSVTADTFFDDVLISVTTGDYPLGAGVVLPFAPTRDGVHNVSGSNFIRNAAGTAIALPSSDLWSFLDDMAVDSTDFVTQAGTSSAQYVEVGFQTTEQTIAPRAVEVLVKRHEASAADCSRSIKLNDNGTEDTIFTSAVAGSTSLVYHTKQYATMPGGGGAWTLARFNDVRVRFGYSADAAPDVYFDGALIEAEFAQDVIAPYRVTPLQVCGMECGVSGAHWTLTNAAFSTSTVRTGLRSLRCNPSGTPANFGISINVNDLLAVARIYVRFGTLPSVDTGICGFATGAAGPGFLGAMFKQSDSKLYPGRVTDVGVVTFGADGIAVTTGVWYQLDLRADNGNNPWLVDLRVNGVATSQYSLAIAADQLSAFTCGKRETTVSVTADMFFDDLLVSITNADYPIGPGHVNAYVCTSDGTHTATGTNIVKGTLGTPVGAAITVATTDSNDWMDATGPIGGGADDTTKLINQQTLLGTEYVELVLAQTVEPTPPRAVEVLSIDRQASTAVGTNILKIRENAANVNANHFFKDGIAGVAADVFVTKQFKDRIGGLGPWTVATFNDLRFRFGYSSDATPDQYLRGLMVEAEFRDPASPAVFRQPRRLVRRGW